MVAVVGETVKVYGLVVIPVTVTGVTPLVYVTLHGCVPVKAMESVVLTLQIVPDPEIAAVGSGRIINVVAVLQFGLEEQAA